MTFCQHEISRIVVTRLRSDEKRLKEVFNQPGHNIRCCWLDNLLPSEILDEAFAGLPEPRTMLRRQSLKECKYVSAALDQLSPAIRTLIAAFNDQEIADVAAALMGGSRLEIDPCFYNGGITMMMPGDFMSPHLDNSHNYDRTQRRAAVLLYYISPPWRAGYGGALELWDDGLGTKPRVIAHEPNRLVILETTEHSWHAVQPVTGPQPRINLTTYYYAPKTEIAAPRLTRYTSWPGQTVRGLYFDADFYLRTLALRLLGGSRPVRNSHAFWNNRAASRKN